MAVPALKFDGTFDQPCDIVLAHGAGQPMDSPFMDAIAAGLAERGLRVARFEFPYMEARRTQGTKRAPDRPEALKEAWRAVVRGLGGGAGLVIGGKSMGGRVASMVADEAGVGGLVVLGYPFHPLGKPERLRTGHLAALRTPMLICQGERDRFGGREEVATYALAPTIAFHWCPTATTRSCRASARATRSTRTSTAPPLRSCRSSRGCRQAEPLRSLSSNSRARAKIASNIGWVRRPVNVFCWLG